MSEQKSAPYAKPAADEPRAVAGIYRRHARACASRRGEPCSCRPSYQAQAWTAREKKPLRKTFATLGEARAWRQEAQVALRKGRLSAPSARTLEEAATEWLASAREGRIRTRSGRRYKPSVIRGYEIALRTKLLPKLGRRRLSAISRSQLQDLADDLVRAGYAPESVRNALMPPRSIYRRAIAREEVSVRQRPPPAPSGPFATQRSPAARHGGVRRSQSRRPGCRG